MVERLSMSVIILVEHLESSMKKLKVQVNKVQQMRKGIHFMRDEIHMDEEEHDFEAWLEGEGAYLKEHILEISSLISVHCIVHGIRNI